MRCMHYMHVSYKSLAPHKILAGRPGAAAPAATSWVVRQIFAETQHLVHPAVPPARSLVAPAA